MNKIIVIGILLIAGYGCQTNKKEEAKEYLRDARLYYNEQKYEKALYSIDSIRLVNSTAYQEIGAGELLRDSLIRKMNEVKIDSLNNAMNEYKRQMYLERITGIQVTSALWQHRIDSIERLKEAPRAVINEISARESKRMACNQCRTIMCQRFRR